MPDRSPSSKSSDAPQQLSLPECSINKTRRRRGTPLRRKKDTHTLTIPDLPEHVVTILKAAAKRRNMTYTAYCAQALTNHAALVLNPRRAR